MKANVHFVPSNDGFQTAIIGPSGKAKSVLGELTPEELAEMTTWSDQQPHSPGSAVDLMAWPGWSEAIVRRTQGD